ncbi:MAG: YigZ family protein [Bacteroidales bacterium]|nr:YigZ family protein [Bacteroidales bacterium]
MIEDTYKTIEGYSEGLYKEKGSKFFAFAYHVSSEESIKEIQKKLRKKYHDARHHCYAFRLGAEKNIFRSSDDGEPSNSSGPPILGQIRSFELTNILIVVVRYFGGTKLGIPGLINAYKTAAQDAINNANIITKTNDDIIEISFDYLAMNDVKKIIKDENLNQIKQDFDLKCSIVIGVRKNNSEIIIKKLEKINSVNLKVCT